MSEDGHACTIDLSVVASEEEIHICSIPNERLINLPLTRASNRARKQSLDIRLPILVCGIGGYSVGEGCRTPLVGEDPYALWFEVEEGWRYCADGHGVLACGGHVGPVGE